MRIKEISFILLFLNIGCTKVWISPAIKGRVVDRAGMPVAGVKIVFKRDEKAIEMMDTSVDGKFDIDARYEWR